MSSALFAIGCGLIVVGGGTKLLIRTYRQIKNKEFFKAAETSRAFYKGTFSTQLTRREAQLILGAREGTTSDQIKARHRTLLMLNHPDQGGSTYVATKINEAKELLLK
ncbi:unnamed protein product [Paramecium sonneborni]|uniref:Mitochondrial import inner membrane translocase subunit TIM14 n=1 Tax=Paramecium sonneborni TaxID=65129 RepID=A0A8S1Q3M6_9CILI|nr:unnamed protein product [Paramecium sonneborni]